MFEPDVNAAFTVPPPRDRRTFIGGSDVAAILGLSPWKTPLELYLEKIAEAPPDAEREEARRKVLARGKKLEPIVLEMLAEEHGLKVVARNLRYDDPAHPFMSCEIDFEIEAADGEIENGEIKTVHPFKKHEWGEEGTDELPIHYTAQAMWGLGITGRRRTTVGALFGADNLVHYVVERDEDTIAAIRQKVLTFWHDHVLARVPPPPINMDDVAILYTDVRGVPVEATEYMADAMRQLREARERRRLLDDEINDLEFRIVSGIAHAWGPTVTNTEDDALLVVNGAKAGSWKRQRGTYLDQKALKAAHPDIVAQFTREHFFRVLRVSKAK